MIPTFIYNIIDIYNKYIGILLKGIYEIHILKNGRLLIFY